MVAVETEGNRRVLAAVDDAARGAGLRIGMTVAHAQSLVPDLHLVDATPAEDADSLERLALWCTRYSPLVTLDPPDGVFIDIAGSAHLFKGEAALLKDLARRLEGAGLAARLAVADTPGCAFALARLGQGGIVAPGQMADALGGLPVAALRLPLQTVQSLRDIGIERVAHLARLPRGGVRQRFGGEVLLRLDQALGATSEALTSIQPPEVPRATMKFVDPVSDPDDLKRVIAKLLDKLVVTLERRGVGARRLDLVFLRVDNIAQAVRIGTSCPNRDGKHLTKLLVERLVQVDPGFGIERATLTASWVEALTERQTVGRHVARESEDDELETLVDTLHVRLGPQRVFRLAAVESDIPERAMKRIAPLAKADGAIWPPDLPRPARLLSPPEPVMVIAEIPDAPPRSFTWQKQRHRVVHADGPERILGEWWKADAEVASQREYFRVETECGERFWLFRDAPAENGGRWFLHGLGEA
ncbi:protein ImuB [Rhizobiales bacterium GAS188]|nr:protein ImuB [Rhizobiales bacterium GAS188]